MVASPKQIVLSYTDGGDYTYTRALGRPIRNRFRNPTPQKLFGFAPNILAFWFGINNDSAAAAYTQPHSQQGQSPHRFTHDTQHNPQQGTHEKKLHPYILTSERNTFYY